MGSPLEYTYVTDVLIIVLYTYRSCVNLWLIQAFGAYTLKLFHFIQYSAHLVVCVKYVSVLFMFYKHGLVLV